MHSRKRAMPFVAICLAASCALAVNIGPTVLIRSATIGTDGPRVAATSNVLLTTWTEVNGTNSHDVRAALALPNGMPVKPYPIDVFTGPGNQSHARVSFSAGRFVVGWSDDYGGIYVTTVGVSGQVSRPPLTVQSPSTNSAFSPELVLSVSSNALLVAWADTTANTSTGQVRGALLLPDASSVVVSPFVINSNAWAKTPDSLRGSSDGATFLLAWGDPRSYAYPPTSKGIYFTRVYTNGLVESKDGVRLLDQYYSGFALAWGSTSYLFAAAREDTGPTRFYLLGASSNEVATIDTGQTGDSRDVLFGDASGWDYFNYRTPTFCRVLTSGSFGLTSALAYAGSPRDMACSGPHRYAVASTASTNLQMTAFDLNNRSNYYITVVVDNFAASDPTGSNAVEAGGSTVLVVRITNDFYRLTNLTLDGYEPVSFVADSASYTVLVAQCVSDLSLYAAVDARRAPLGTPLWWLASFGLTNNYSQEEIADSDNDGASAWSEYRTHCDPTNSLSFPVNTDPISSSNGVFRLLFPTAAGRVYNLETATDPSSTWSPIPGYDNIPGTGSPVLYLIASPTGRRYFRLNVLY
jgi:hypothetical protein